MTPPKPKLRTLSDMPIFDDENYGLIEELRQAAQEWVEYLKKTDFITVEGSDIQEHPDNLTIWIRHFFNLK